MAPALNRTVAPTSEPVTLPQAKAHLYVLDSAKDTVIRDFLKAAREQFEDRTGRVLMTQTWEQLFDWFPNTIQLLRSPVQSVSSIKYIDTDGTEQTLAASEYVLDAKSEPARIVEAFGTSWPSTQDTVNAVTVTFLAGYTSAALVPPSIKSAIKLMLGHLYEHREAVVMGGAPITVPMAVDALLAQHRVPWV